MSSTHGRLIIDKSDELLSYTEQFSDLDGPRGVEEPI